MIAIVVILMIPMGALAQVPMSSLTKDEQAAFLLAGMRQARESLRSGQFRASGRIAEAASSNHPQRPWEVFCAFDFVRGLFRFDQDLAFEWATESAQTELRMMRHRYARSEDRSLHSSNVFGGSDVVIKASDAPHDAQFLYPFDIRAIGFALPYSVRKGTPFEEQCESIRRYSLKSLDELGDGVYRLTWRMGDQGKPLFILCIDERKGYVPTYMEARVDISEEEARQLPPHLSPVEVSSHVSWKNLSEVWVPTAMRLEAASEVMELAFDWEQVNQPVDKVLFTPKGLGLPPDSQVFDHRLGEPILVGTLHDPVRKTERSASAKTHPLRWGLTGVLSFLVVVTLVLVVRRYFVRIV